ncbi:MAG: hypothetical protein H7301_10475 [Cryobacterium sp.]|nr:hypothetical protein [Oligoflexia bacterium]
MKKKDTIFRCWIQGLWLIGVFVVTVNGFILRASADSSNYARHVDREVGIELNILWPLKPFSTYEVKVLLPISNGADLVIGFGRQAWTMKDNGKINGGSMDSNALIIGAKQFLFHTSTVVEYDAWLAHDRLTSEDGKVYAGWSLSNEFYGGYQFYLGSTRSWVSTGMNAGFWSFKSYEAPKNDRFVLTVLPKITAGFEAK